MPSLCPTPQGFEDSMIHFDKGALARGVLMIVGPAPDFGIEDSYQVSGGRLRIASNDFSDFGQEGFDILPRGFGNDLPMILADSLSQEVKAIHDMRDTGFLG